MALAGTRKKRVESREALALEPGKMGRRGHRPQVWTSQPSSRRSTSRTSPLLDGHDLVLERAALLVKLKELGVDNHQSAKRSRPRSPKLC